MQLLLRKRRSLMKKKKTKPETEQKLQELDMAARVIRTWTSARKTRYPLMSMRARKEGKKHGRK